MRNMPSKMLKTYEVAYATPARQLIVEVKSELESLTVEQAIEQSAIQQQFPEIDLSVNKLGIFSKPTTLKTILEVGDRVEIYRPLIADPKEIRRQRAEAGKATKKGMRAKPET